MKVTLLRMDGLDVAMLGASVCVSKEMPTEPRPEGLTKALSAHHDSLLEHIVELCDDHFTARWRVAQ